MDKTTIYSIGAFAKLTSVTERTLRYYDRKGLLRPSSYNAQGHRMYSDRDLFRLQEILSLKYLDYSLEEIAQYLDRPNMDFLSSLTEQYELLQQKKRHIEAVLSTIERTKAIAQDTSSLDSQLIIMIIHSIQHEEDMKSWLSERLPDKFVSSIFMKDKTAEERLELDRYFVTTLNDISAMHKQGYPPHHSEVLEKGRGILQMMEEGLGINIMEVQGLLLKNEARQALEADSDPLDLMLFLNIWTPEEELFLANMFELLLSDYLRSNCNEGGDDLEQA
ncbi:MerR family transcriptional regulator [Paenibacillaceae bacterium]|nr:MerR family transcriptional regulator [Paenibacillaceae bacterium]